MTRHDVIEKLRATEPDLKARGVAGLYLFGSHARGQAGSSSDIDLFVDPAIGALQDLDGFMGPYRILQNTFPGIQVGYSTRSGLSKYVRAAVEREAIRVF